MDILRFNNFVQELSKDTPIKVAYKDESRLMKLIGTLMFFNKGFMDIYITTLGNTVYYPSKKWVMDNTTDATLVMAHEYVHIKDNIKYGKVFYPIMYLFPQVLAVLSVLTLLAFVTPYAWFFLLFLLCAGPIPSPGRKHIELRGYKMSLYSYDLYLKEHTFLSDERKERLLNLSESSNMQFTSGAYYFMWPTGVLSDLTQFSKDIINDKVQDPDGVYKDVTCAFENSK